MTSFLNAGVNRIDGINFIVAEPRKYMGGMNANFLVQRGPGGGGGAERINVGRRAGDNPSVRAR
jgi:hypothetical protein